MSKRISQSAIIGERGIAHIRRIVLDMGYLFYETGAVEAGIDGIIELRDQKTGRVGNLILQVQSKATERDRLPAETAVSFEWRCTEADVAYWLQGTAPVLLIVVQTKTNRAYWKSIKDYFSEPKLLGNRHIVFNKKKDIFDLSAKASIATIAANAKLGAITPPARITEHLISNLVPVQKFGSKLFSADTKYRGNRTFGAAFRQLTADVPGEWIVKDGRLLSFHDLNRYPWIELCDIGTIEQFDTTEWALSTDRDRERDFVQLLNRALRQLTHEDLFFDKSRHIYYFKYNPRKPSRRYSYYASKNRTERQVVHIYTKKRTQTETAYLRHSAFKGRFLRFDNSWYLEVTPTYHFTCDGRNEDRFASEHLKKIKEIEKNDAVLGQFLMWCYYLINRGSEDIFAREYPFLKFDMAGDYTVEQGIPDGFWRSQTLRRLDLAFDNKIEF